MKIRIQTGYLNEFLFVLYLFLFTILKSFLVQVPQYSSMILFVCTLLILLISLFRNYGKMNNLLMFLCILVGVSSLLFMDSIFRPNRMQMMLVYDFVIYGVIPLYLLMHVSNFTAVLKYYSFFSIFLGILYYFDPLKNYASSGNYMVYGFSIILPAFCGAVLQVFYFRSRKSWIMLILFLVNLILFGNKSAIVCGIVLAVTAYVGFNYKSGIRWNRVVLVMLAMVVVILFQNEILEFAIAVANVLNIDSYSLRSLQYYLLNNNGMLFGSRISIWQEALSYVTDTPVVGRGIGFMESLGTNATNYAHNVFIEILVASGILGVSVFTLFLLASVWKLRKCTDSARRVFSIMVLALWFVPMLFSLTLWRVSYFWVYWGLIYYRMGKPQSLPE